MKQFLYNVDMKEDATGKKIELRVWAKNVDDATHKIVDAIGGYRGEYTWCGSGPVYENNNLVSRIVADIEDG